MIRRAGVADESALALIIDEYKRPFREESVLRLTSDVRATFQGGCQ